MYPNFQTLENTSKTPSKTVSPSPLEKNKSIKLSTPQKSNTHPAININIGSPVTGTSDVYVYLSIFNLVYFRTKGSCLTPHLVSLSEPDVSSVEIRNLTNIYANVAATDKKAPAINNFLRAFINCFTSDKIILLKSVIKYKKNGSLINAMIYGGIYL